MCPRDQFVSGIKLKNKFVQDEEMQVMWIWDVIPWFEFKDFENISVHGIKIKCRNPMSGEESEEYLLGEINDGEWEEWHEIEQKYIVGGQVAYQEGEEGEDVEDIDGVINGLRLEYKSIA